MGPLFFHEICEGVWLLIAVDDFWAWRDSKERSATIHARRAASKQQTDSSSNALALAALFVGLIEGVAL
jgi:hypothetical protein